MDDNAFGRKFVGDVDDEGVSSDGVYRRPRKLAVDGHHDAFFTVRPPEFIPNLPLWFYNPGRGRVNRHNHHRH